jgi:hypothetical protein
MVSCAMIDAGSGDHGLFSALIGFQQDAKNSTQRAIVIGNSDDSSAWQINFNSGRCQYGQRHKPRLARRYPLTGRNPLCLV